MFFVLDILGFSVMECLGKGEKLSQQLQLVFGRLLMCLYNKTLCGFMDWIELQKFLFEINMVLFQISLNCTIFFQFIGKCTLTDSSVHCFVLDALCICEVSKNRHLRRFH